MLKDYEKVTNELWNEEAHVWMQRNNHAGHYGWDILGFDDREHDKYFLSIGSGSSLLSDSEINEIDGDKTRFNTMMISKTWDNQKHGYFNYLYKFLYDYKKGDYIVIPDTKQFHVFRIVGDKCIGIDRIKDYFNENSWEEITGEDSSIEMHRLWEVEPIRVKIPRKDYAGASLTARMKYRGTLVNADYCNEQVETAIKTKEKLGVLGNYIRDKVRDELKVIFNDKAKNSMNPDYFEELVAWYLEKIGAESEVLPKNPRGKEGIEDADVVGVFENIKVKIFAQCKFKQGEQEIDTAIQQIDQYVEKHRDDEPNKGYHCIKWVIYTGEIQEKDRNVIEARNDIRFINADEFADMLLDCGIRDIDKVGITE